MNDRESRSAEREARRDINAHPERPVKHEEDVRRYLGSALYTEQKAHHEEAREEPEEPEEREHRADKGGEDQ